MREVRDLIIVVRSFCCRVDGGDLGLYVGECGGGVNGSLLEEWRDSWVICGEKWSGLHD